MKILKTILISLLSTILLLIALLAGTVLFWYTTEFYPYQEELQKAIETSKAELGTDINQIYLLANMVATKQGMLIHSSRQSFYYLSYQHKKRRESWHVDSFLWLIILNLLYTDNEIFYLWSHYALFHEGWGINNAAIKMFRKPIVSLELKKQITIMAMIQAPSRFKLGSAELKVRVEYLLKKYHEMSN